MEHQEKKAFDVTAVEEKLKNIKTFSDLMGPEGVIQTMIKSTVERILKAEQEAHLGYEKHQKSDDSRRENSRNGYSKKTFKTTAGSVDLDIPRDRDGSFNPLFIAKHQRFDVDLEKRITGMYARGMSVRDISKQLEEFYGTAVSPALISKITDSVLEGVEAWQNRPLNDVYAIMYMDAIFYKVRHEGKVVSKASYTCLGINLAGKVEVLGIWISESEGAHFWLNVMSELKRRGVQDVLIACVDGLKGFPEAIGSIFPKAMVQLCVVHQIRNSLKYVASKYQREFIQDLKTIYQASSEALAEQSLVRVEEKWASRYPSAIASWRNNWTHLSTYFSFPEDIRRIIYTTNLVEAVHRQFRKVTKAKSFFPTDDALKKMLYLATLDMKARHKQNWAAALGQLKIIFPERVSDEAMK